MEKSKMDIFECPFFKYGEILMKNRVFLVILQHKALLEFS
uniref:Uncharacterized protein n=1 Tax=viral metagenome TaxID=1070528 RepID=A0A6C0DEA7_9ZZZZ